MPTCDGITFFFSQFFLARNNSFRRSFFYVLAWRTRVSHGPAEKKTYLYTASRTRLRSIYSPVWKTIAKNRVGPIYNICSRIPDNYLSSPPRDSAGPLAYGLSYHHTERKFHGTATDPVPAHRTLFHAYSADRRLSVRENDHYIDRDSVLRTISVRSTRII
jgi:hypothetical protein